MEKIPSSLPHYQLAKVNMRIKLIPETEDDQFYIFVVYHQQRYYLFYPGSDSPFSASDDYNNVIEVMMIYMSDYNKFKTFDISYFKPYTQTFPEKYSNILKNYCCYDSYETKNIPLDEFKTKMKQMFIGLGVLSSL